MNAEKITSFGPHPEDFGALPEFNDVSTILFLLFSSLTNSCSSSLPPFPNQQQQLPGTQ